MNCDKFSLTFVNYYGFTFTFAVYCTTIIAFCSILSTSANISNYYGFTFTFKVYCTAIITFCSITNANISKYYWLKFVQETIMK